MSKVSLHGFIVGFVGEAASFCYTLTPQVCSRYFHRLVVCHGMCWNSWTGSSGNTGKIQWGTGVASPIRKPPPIYLFKFKWISHFSYFFSLPFSRVFVPGKEEGVRHHSHFPPHCFEENVKKERKRKHYYSQFILGKLRTPAGPQTFVVEFSSFLFFVFSWVFFFLLNDLAVPPRKWPSSRNESTSSLTSHHGQKTLILASFAPSFPPEVGTEQLLWSVWVNVDVNGGISSLDRRVLFYFSVSVGLSWRITFTVVETTTFPRRPHLSFVFICLSGSGYHDGKLHLWHF